MTVQNPTTDDLLSPMTETDLRETLDDGPRAGNCNPTPEVLEELLAQITNENQKK